MFNFKKNLIAFIIRVTAEVDSVDCSMKYL